jgi:hypothetical protein
MGAYAQLRLEGRQGQRGQPLEADIDFKSGTSIMMCLRLTLLLGCVQEQEEGGGAERDVDMEVVFKPGLEELSQRLAARTPARKGDAKLAKDYVRRKR